MLRQRPWQWPSQLRPLTTPHVGWPSPVLHRPGRAEPGRRPRPLHLLLSCSGHSLMARTCPDRCLAVSGKQSAANLGTARSDKTVLGLQETQIGAGHDSRLPEAPVPGRKLRQCSHSESQCWEPKAAGGGGVFTFYRRFEQGLPEDDNQPIEPKRPQSNSAALSNQGPHTRRWKSQLFLGWQCWLSPQPLSPEALSHHTTNALPRVRHSALETELQQY